MPDQVQDPQTPATEEPTEETTSSVADDKVAELEAKVREYESRFLSPEYADFLRHRAGVQQPQQQPQQRKQWTAEERQEFESRLDGLSKGEFAAYVRDATVEKIRNELFAPLARDIIQERVQQDIAVTAAKYPDFGSYREEMIAISNANPSLRAEQVYLLAKAQRSGQVPAPRPQRKSAGEVPTGPTASPKTPTGKVTFDTAFNDAFKKAGF